MGDLAGALEHLKPRAPILAPDRRFDTVLCMSVWESIAALPGAHRRGFLVGVLPVFLLFGLYLYLPSLAGGPVSDDWFYFGSPYVRELGLANVADILNPYGNTARSTMNYAPVHLLVHAAEFELLGPSLPLHHLVSVVLHGVTAWLFVLLLVSCGGAPLASTLTGFVFLVHPANVEAVAILFQLKTILSTGLVMAVLLLHGRHPIPAAALFGLAILTKISAAVALPVAAAMAWTRQGRGDDSRSNWGWLAVWLAATLLVAIPEFEAFSRAGSAPEFIRSEPLVQMRSIIAIGMRYLVMAGTGFGLSTSHQPAPASSWLDPWWLSGLVVQLLLLARTVVTLRRRQLEGAFWLMAAGAFAPISQVFPFLYPMADRYLYGILPGLLGGTLLLVQWALRPLSASDGAPAETRRPRAESIAACLGVLVLAIGFAGQSSARIPVFASDLAMAHDAAANYPDGIQANLLRMAEAGVAGNGAAAAVALRAAFSDGWAGFAQVMTKPYLAGVLDDPQVQAVLREMASHWIEEGQKIEHPVQADEYMLSLAYDVHGELALATAAAERGLTMTGAYDQALREQLARLRKRSVE